MGTTGTHGVMTALESLGMHGYHWRDSRASANEHANKSKLPDFVVPLLDKLGSNVSFNECYKTVESFDFSQLPSNVDYVSDSPFTEMFLDLYMQFPGAKVVLTTRPSLEWAKRRKKVHKFTPVPVLRPCGQSWMLEHYRDQTLAAMLDAYHDLVRCVVPPDNLLEIDLFNGDANLTLALSNFLKAAK
ncbi:unnamed protein product [Effrenium voratum]|nr:unnamed protein product [Effrenium voratum]